MHQQEPLQEQINRIIALFSSGQAQEALDSVRALIKDYPNEPVPYNISGACYAALGQLDEAVKNYKKSLAIKPDYAEVHNNLGNALIRLGKFNSAVNSLEKALAIKPDFVDAHYNLGLSLQELSQLDDAVKCYEKALAIKPDFAEAHNNLGVTLKELIQLDDAVNSYEKAIAIKPDFAEAHNNLGIALKELSQLDDAVKSYEKAIAIKPDYIEAHNNLGNALKDLGQIDRAIKYLEKTLTIKPDYAEVHNNLGIILMDLGQLDHAIKHYEKAISIKADYTSAHLNLSYLKKYTASDPQIAKMQSLLSSDKITQSGRIDLCFALAKVNENLDNQDELFKYLNEGNRLHKQELNYSFDKQQKIFAIIKEIFNKNPPNIEQSLLFEPSTFKPIFIVGMPRSGSTLVEQIMSSHHAVHGAGEFQDLRKLLGVIISDNLAPGSDITSTSIGDKIINFSNAYSIPETAFLSLRKQYLDVLSHFNVPESVITDKSLLNFRFIGFILTAFPEAKIIHMKRDARAICWSIYNIYLKGFDFGNDFKDLAGFYGLYTELMDFWHQLFPGQIYDICYEDLTTNQEEETKKLLQYCELDWDENCLSFHKNKRAVKTASALQVRQKIYQGSSEAWKKYEVHLKPLIKALDSY
jgi:tetratricopeptide (TPR) repeat protein